MAQKLKGIYIEIGAETKGIDKALADVNKRAKETAIELRQVEKLLKLDPKNTQLVAQKQQLLSDQVATTRQKLLALKNAQEQVDEQFRTGKIGIEQYRAFQREIIKTEAELKRLEAIGKTSFADVGKAVESAGGKIQSLGKKLGATGAGIKATGMNLTMGLTVPIVTAEAAVAKFAMDFDQAMRNVNSIAKLPEKQFQKLRQAVLDMAGEVGKTPQDLAEGLYQIYSSGFEGAQGLAVLEASARAARAGISTTEEAVTAITGVLNAYGLKGSQAAHVSDVLFKTVERGVITFPELAQQLGDVTSTAAAMKINIEQVGGAIAAFTKAGIPGAEAVTALNRVIISFAKPSDAMAAFIKKAGYESGQAMLQHLGLGKTLQLVSKNTKGNVTALGELFPEIRGMKGALVAVNGAGKLFNGEMKAVGDNANATGQALAQQEKGPLARWEKAWAKISARLITVGEKLIPFIEQASDKAGELADKFAELSPKQQESILKWGALAAVVGPVLVILGGAVQVLGAIVTAVGAVVQGIGFLIPLLPALATPVGATALAVGGLSAALLFVAGKLRELPTRSTGGALDDLRVVTDRARDASNEYADAQKRVRDHMDRARDASKRLKDAELDLAQAELDLARAKDAHRDAQDGVNEAAGRYGKKSSEYRRAVQDLKQSEIDLARASGRTREAAEVERKAQSDLSIEHFRVRDAKRAAAEAADRMLAADGLAVRQARLLAAASLHQHKNYLDLIPATGTLKDKVLAYRDAQAKLTDAIRTYGANSPQAQTASRNLTTAEDKLRAAADRAEGKVRDLAGSFKALPAHKSVTLDVKTRGLSQLERAKADLEYLAKHPYLSPGGLAILRQGGQLPKFASGGVITKPTVALVGEQGTEYIFNQRQMDALMRAQATAPITAPMSVGPNYINNDMDIDRIATRLADKYEQELRNRGLVA